MSSDAAADFVISGVDQASDCPVFKFPTPVALINFAVRCVPAELYHMVVDPMLMHMTNKKSPAKRSFFSFLLFNKTHQNDFQSST